MCFESSRPHLSLSLPECARRSPTTDVVCGSAVARAALLAAVDAGRMDLAAVAAEPGAGRPDAAAAAARVGPRQARLPARLWLPEGAQVPAVQAAGASSQPGGSALPAVSDSIVRLGNTTRASDSRAACKPEQADFYVTLYHS